MRKLKRALVLWIAICCIYSGGFCVPVSATTQTTTAVTETQSTPVPSRTFRILAFLGIFTVCFAGGIYVGVRPALKRLKADKEDEE